MDTLLGIDQHPLFERTAAIVLPRFGECSYAETEVFTFPWGLPGFTALRRFLVLSLGEEDGYIWLQSLDDLRVAIPLCDPWSLFDDYEAPLPQYALQSLGIESAEDFCVMCVLVANPGGLPTTINLLAPVVINLEKRIGRQITLENQRYTVRTPVPARPSATKEVEPN